MTQLANQAETMGIDIDDQDLFMMVYKDNQSNQYRNLNQDQ